MPELNKANRQVCDVDIRVLKTMAPFLFSILRILQLLV